MRDLLLERFSRYVHVCQGTSHFVNLVGMGPGHINNNGRIYFLAAFKGHAGDTPVSIFTNFNYFRVEQETTSSRFCGLLDVVSG